MQLKYLIFIFILIVKFVAANPTGSEIKLSGYLFDEVIITGATNVNSFQLLYNEDRFTTLINYPVTANDKLQICIPARNITSEPKLMLADFLQMINAKEHPTIAISMNATTIKDLSIGEVLDHQICVAINGTKKEYQCVSEILSCKQNEICLKGKLNVLLTDFGIDPPRKFLGIVKVKNEVFISFRLLFSTEKKETKN